MGTQKLDIYNGQKVDIAKIPIYDEESFRNEIITNCREASRIAGLFGMPDENGGVRIIAILGKDEDSDLGLLSLRISKDKPFYKSLTPDLPEAHWFEREIAEQYAITPVNHPWLKPVRYHKNYRNVPDIWHGIGDQPISGEYPFYKLKGHESHEVAVGPVHAGVIEPGHFRFQCHGEEIIHLEIQLGFQHRGIEKMMEEVSFERAILIAEAIAGDTVIGHTSAYCQLLESLSDTLISPRADALRAIALELERLACHSGDIGFLSADIGFLPIASYFGRIRGEFLNMLLLISGSRFGKSFCRPGGVLFDIDEKMKADLSARLENLKKEIIDLEDVLFSKPSVLSRFEGVGIISETTAKELGLVGPVARASGLGRDVRTDYAFGMYRFSHLPMTTVTSGDVFARAQLRWLEMQRSMDFILDLLNELPKGEICKPLKPLKPNKFALAMVEGWRGEIMHAAFTGNNSEFTRYKIKDPSFHNWMALAMAVRGAQISDFPLCNKSFNLSYCGHDL
ncbi:MAG: hypothetical protein ACD_79C01029G0001 [uncultured bacterium]|nr:MAG: hypothetical protein ACD_79C01029G0001 [uncultured bacterium]